MAAPQRTKDSFGYKHRMDHLDKASRIHLMVMVEANMLTGCHEYSPGSYRRTDKETGLPAVNVDELCRACGYSEESVRYVQSIRETEEYQKAVATELNRRKIAIADNVIASLKPVSKVATLMLQELEARLLTCPEDFTSKDLLTSLPGWIKLAAILEARGQGEGEDMFTSEKTGKDGMNMGTVPGGTRGRPKGDEPRGLPAEAGVTEEELASALDGYPG